MNVNDNPSVVKSYEMTFTPLISVKYSVHEDGTISVSNDIDICWDDSLGCRYDPSTGETSRPPEEEINAVDQLLNLVKLVEYYQPAWSPQDEPF